MTDDEKRAQDIRLAIFRDLLRSKPSDMPNLLKECEEISCWVIGKTEKPKARD